MLSLLCIDNNLQQQTQLKLDISQLFSDIDIIEASTVQQAQQLILENRETLAIVLCALPLCHSLFTPFLEGKQYPPCRKITYAQSPSSADLLNCINQNHIDFFLQLPYQTNVLKQIITTQITLYNASIMNNISATNNSDLAITAKKAKKASCQPKFLDYSLYSDLALSKIVINTLHQILEKNDEHKVRRCYSANHILTREGDKNQFLWFITKGEVLLKKRNKQGDTQDITVMNAGTIVGGMSFLTKEVAFSTGITLTKTEVLKVDNTIFSQIMQSNSTLLAPFTNLLLRNFNRRLQHSISTELALQETLESLDIAHQRLIESEKMAVLGQLVAGIAHELNNPIAAILRGSDTLIGLISTLLARDDNTDNNSDFSKLAKQTLQQGLTVTPLSTSEARNRTNKLLTSVKDKNIAKKLVNMHLDNEDIPVQDNRDLSQTVNLLNQYHQAGTILRNSNACAVRIANLVKGLKHYAGQDSTTSTTTDIGEGLEETLVIFESKLKNYQVTKEYQQLPKVACYPIELEQVWTNIISNAIDATEGQGALKISTIYLANSEKPQVQVIIEDNGPGMPQSVLDKIFELNYTSKREGNFGLGIGLTICSQIIKRHGGTIEVESEIARFTRFIITLPVFNATLDSEPSPFINTFNKEK